MQNLCGLTSGCGVMDEKGGGADGCWDQGGGGTSGVPGVVGVCTHDGLDACLSMDDCEL